MADRPARDSLSELFHADRIDRRLTWHAEPRRWAVNRDKGCLEIEPDDETDFWRKTHYGFEADNGHFLSAPVTGDAVVTAHVRFSPAHQYDQAGLMVRIDAENWIKLAIEHETTGPAQLGCVVTQEGYSDWSMQAWSEDPPEVWLRLRREDGVYWAQWSRTKIEWSPLRLTKLRADAGTCPWLAGVYACSPKKSGFVAEFRELSIVGGSIGKE